MFAYNLNTKRSIEDIRNSGKITMEQDDKLYGFILNS